MKKFLSISVVFLVLAVLFSSYAGADSVKKSGAFSYTIKGNGTAEITAYDWSMNDDEDIYVPELIDGYKVTSIGDMAFTDKELASEKLPDPSEFPATKHVRVHLPDSIQIIGEKAFFCTDITSVNIPAGVASIGSGAFAGCSRITTFSVDPNNSTYAVIDGVLYNKVIKELVAFPIGSETDEFQVPYGIKSIGPYAFFDIYDKTLICSETVTSIKEYAFYGVLGAILDLGEVVSIGDYAFAGIDPIGFISDLQLGNSLEEIGSYAFYYCNFLNFNGGYGDIIFPSSLRTIGSHAFDSYSGSHDVDLSNTYIEVIPDYCFYDSCYSSIYLPRSVKIIGDYAFSSSDLSDYINSSGKYGMPTGLSDLSSLESIGDCAFKDARLSISQESINLPENLKTIGSDFFENVEYRGNSEHIEQISIPASVTSIGDSFCDKSSVVLDVEPGSYAALYASENGYITSNMQNQDTSWLLS